MELLLELLKVRFRKLGSFWFVFICILNFPVDLGHLLADLCQVLFCFAVRHFPRRQEQICILCLFVA